MSANPFISIIVPTHRRPPLLRRAIASITTQDLDQLTEIIVVSDEHHPETNTVANKALRPCDTFLRRSGQPGPSLSRNLGISMARGNYLAFLDDDDEWHPNYLETLKSAGVFRARRFTFSDCVIVTEQRGHGEPTILEERPFEMAARLNEYIFVQNQIHMSCLLFPKDLLADVRFDPYMLAYEDWDFILSVLKKEVPYYLPGIASRIHEVVDNTTDRRGDAAQAKGDQALVDYLYVYRRHPSPNAAVGQLRQKLLNRAGFPLKEALL
jgi:GalNAc5-diNAcBac-PP-undecaprenol beta-1,3-glucosyltransferase